MASSTNRGPTNHQPVTYLGPEKSILRRTSETSESFRGSAKNPIINRLQMHETWIIHELYMDYKWLYMDYISVMDETPLIQWFALASPVPDCPAILVELAAKFVKVLEKQPFFWVDKP